MHNIINNSIPGWRSVRLIDIAAIPVLLFLTLGAGLIFRFDAESIPGTNAVTGKVILFTSLAAIIEELCFRSLLPWLLCRFLNTRIARSVYPWVASTLIFAALHVWQGWNGMIFAACMGALYSVYLIQNGSLLVLMIVHILYNLTALFS